MPFKSIVTLVTDKVESSGRLPLMESLEMGSEIPELILMGLITRVWVYETITDEIISCRRGVLMFHLRVAALALHRNNNCSPGQTDAVLCGSRINSFSAPTEDDTSTN